MALEKSNLLSATGTIFQIVKAIIDEVLALGGDDEDVREILRDKNLPKQIAKIIMAKTVLLKRVTTVSASGTERFITKDHLKKANVGWTGENFNRLFLNKVEENIPDAKLTVSRLETASLDAPILAELGDKAEVKLTYLFDLLKKQAKGNDGVLLTNGYANIFYIRGTDNNLWAVNAHWDSGRRDWNVEAYSVEDPYRWNDGYQVFSRDS